MKVKVMKRFIDGATMKNGRMDKGTRTYEPNDMVECTEQRYKELAAGKFVQPPTEMKGGEGKNGKQKL